MGMLLSLYDTISIVFIILRVNMISYFNSNPIPMFV